MFLARVDVPVSFEVYVPLYRTDGWVALNWDIGAESRPGDRGINILQQGHLAGRTGEQVFADTPHGA